MTDLSLQDLIAAVEQADSPARLVGAVRALAIARLEAAIPTLIRVLGYNNPGAAVAAVEGLVQLGEAAVEPLLELLDDYNYGARAYAIRALAAIADPRALDVLLAAGETDFAPSVRRAATKGMGHLQWQKLSVAEARPAAQAKVLDSLLRISHDDDWSIRYAAVVGLETLATSIESTELLSSLLDRLAQMANNDPDTAAQARALLAQHRLQIAIPMATH